MATKKQKRAAVAARTEAFLAEERELGRQAIERGKREREKKNLESWKKGHEKHYKFVDECPHCEISKARQAEEARRKAIDKVATATAEQQSAARLSRTPKAEIEGVDVFHPFAQKVDA